MTPQRRKILLQILTACIATPLTFLLGIWLLNPKDDSPAPITAAKPAAEIRQPEPQAITLQLPDPAPVTPAPTPTPAPRISIVPPNTPTFTFAPPPDAPTPVPAEIRPRPSLFGAIGLGTWDTTAEFKDILVTSADNKNLLKADFANGMTGWNPLDGEWKGSSGLLTQTSRNIDCRIIGGDVGWADYTYSLKAKKTAGTEGFLIIYAAKSPADLYWWNIGGWGNSRAAVEKMTRGAKIEIRGTAVPLTVQTGQWYDIKIDLRGNVAMLHFDNKLISIIDNDTARSTLPDAGAPQIFNNGAGPMRGDGTIIFIPANPGPTQLNPAPTPTPATPTRGDRP